MEFKKYLVCCLCLFAITLAAQNSTRYNGEETNKIKVLNFGTFHMGLTTDENKTEFDENDEKNIKEVHQIAEKLAQFKPTVILVETVPDYNARLQEQYAEYAKNPQKRFKNPSEIELLAYELGRLVGAKRIYGVDHKMGYNYKVAREINNQIDNQTITEYYKNPFKGIEEYDDSNENNKDIPLLDKLKLCNADRYLDFLISINSDVLTHAGTDGNFEGADEAAKYYKRNLRMYSNINRINLKPEDRVFILMGASHTAFFRDFISRSPKYIMVDTFKYLK
ncbi:DUF5694 domain-containing protein [Croceitalea rosinachiae]|uniref:DUF5694 domain-containing protein n=1 Tax=Croceitalea rosinachiae TaxID=3075596 RepID=A0ABU3AHT5_9FLAO|nr:DUF5694 domain-containing protein [Croceitalea sp. F388]MDT0608461.1 DUF5694 domain-containing protein [Croceitalea sp. F388]